MIIYLIASLYNSSYMILAIFVISIIAIPWTVFIPPLFLFGAIYFYKKQLKATKQTSSLENQTRLPVFEYFNESLVGSQTVRAYQIQA